MTPEVLVIKVSSPIEAPTFNFLLCFAPPEKRERILRQRVKQNANNMAVGAALAKYMVYRTFHIPTEKQRIAYGSHGKPYLPDYPNVHFNISHSGQFVACAVCDRPVGLDIQKVRPYDPAVAHRVCSIAELAEIERSDDAALTFTKLWTQKEASLKMMGVGIAGGELELFPPHNITIKSSNVMDYMLSVCTSCC